MSEPPVYGWHFPLPDRTLAHSGEPVEVGRTYRVPGPVILCEEGLHGSLRLIDALRYAPGSILTRCSFGGEITYGNDKLAATERTVLWIGDIEPVLHEVACHFAETALRVAKVTDPRSWAAVEAKRAWLRGEITKEQLDAALDAARAAASAARDAASAAWAAARAAAWAAWAAARDAARDAASAASAAASAARAAASAAARDALDAAWAAQNDYIEAAVRDFAGVA